MVRFKSGLFQAKSNDIEPYQNIAAFFDFFSNPSALMILGLIRKKGMTPLAISRKLGTTSRSVLQKLRKMKQQGIVDSCLESSSAMYRLTDPKIVRAFDRVLKIPAKMLTSAGSSKKKTVRTRTK
jgi:DNA-binding transcriptional ArsR family regulator